MGKRNERAAVIPLCFRENTSVHVIQLMIFVVADIIIFFLVYCHLSECEFMWERQKEVVEEETERLSV